MTFVVPLGELGRRDLALAGGKGANLGELVRAGLPVPDGFVVTTDAYAACVSPLDLKITERVGAGGAHRFVLILRPLRCRPSSVQKLPTPTHDSELDQ